MTSTELTAGLLHPRHKDLREAMGTAYRREMAATRSVARREGCPVIRSAGITLNAMGDDGHAGRSYSWDGTRRGLIGIIEDFASNPRVDLVFIDHFFDGHEFITGDGDERTQIGGFSLDVWKCPRRHPNATPSIQHQNAKLLAQAS